jgi:hypothetical protein
MATEDKKTDDKPKTGAELLQRAEEYAKNPEDMDKFTKDREKQEEEAKKKAEEAKKNQPTTTTQAAQPAK